MARKSKGFGELLRQQQQTQGQQQAMERLGERVQKNLQGKIAGVVMNPKGEAKMSEVLEAFVEPYLDVAIGYEQRLKLFSIAVMAWNLALMPEKEQPQQMEKLIREMVGRDRQAQRDTREILEEMMERKRTFFADNQRYIVDFELGENRNKIHLSVVSTMVEPTK